MDIKSIRERKKNIEDTIAGMMESFEKDTTMRVKDIDIIRGYYLGGGGKIEQILVNVEV